MVVQVEEAARTVPAAGQTARVRSRAWVVSAVRGDGQDGAHVVDLVSIEDDTPGEELRVVWELEPGAAALTHGTLPEVRGFDSPARLRAFLDAVRWGAIASADTRRLQAPFRAGITIEDYQLVPLNRALRMARANLLIADDVGLGKTIEAGLVALELILRQRARTVLIVCPPSLQVQWQEQMREKFGLEFRIVDREHFRAVRRESGIHLNPWTSFPRLITSIDFLKRPQPMRLMRDTLPNGDDERFPRRFDLLIVDEAHNVAPAGSGKYATDSARTKALREITPHFEHRLFLTATPHNGYQESFSALLELLDDQRFARAVPPDPRQRDQVMVRRLKTDLEFAPDGTRRFADRVVSELPVRFTAEEDAAYRKLHQYFELRRQHGGESKGQQICLEFVLKTLKKRFFSSPAAFARTIDQHIRSIERARSGATLAVPDEELRARFAEFEDEMELAGSELDETDPREDAADALAGGLELAAAGAPRVSPEAMALARELRDWAEKAANRPDSKAAALLAWLDEHVARQDERVIVFTEYRDTQKWLAGLLASRGYLAHGRTELVHGGLDRAERERIKAAFQADPAEAPVRILLATDAASEGLDLQNHCHQVIHFEIPWNPNRLEQRNGRVDRHGQPARQVFVHHFVGEGYAQRNVFAEASLGHDLEFLGRVAKKVDQIRADLGSTGPVLSSRVEAVLLGESRGSRSLDDIGASARDRRARDATPADRGVNAEIRTALDTMKETQDDLDLTPERVRATVAEALDLAGELPLRPVTLSDHHGATVTAWEVPRFSTPSWADTRKGLEHPYSGAIRPVVFDHDAARRLGDRVVLAHLKHPLVDRSLRFLRAAIWGDHAAAAGGLHRVTAWVVPDGALDALGVFAWGRMVVTGGDGQRLHEQIIAAGGRVREGRFSRLNVGEVDRALSAPALDVDLPGELRQAFIPLWPAVRDGLAAALEARQRDRANNLRTTVEARRESEIAAITAVLDELETSIRKQIAEFGSDRQLTLFQGYSEAEQEQARRDREWLERRLAALPAERAREIDAIGTRFGDTRPRLFPVAVAWLVPRALVRAWEGR